MSEAVRRLTSRPAQVFGMRGRGVIREGYAADLLLIHLKTVARGPKRRVFDLPGGAPRLTTDAVGVHGVWVNGRMVADGDGLLESGTACGRVADEFFGVIGFRDKAIRPYRLRAGRAGQSLPAAHGFIAALI